MNRKIMNFLLILLIALFTIGITGCEQEGTMEKAGKKIDQAAKDAGKATDEAMKDTGKAIEDAKKKVEDSMEENKG
jgi:hyperosmotically inducible protein